MTLAETMNRVTNHPDVRPWCGGGTDPVDVTHVAEDSSLALYNYGDGFVVFQPVEPGIWEIHVAFEPKTWGVTTFADIQDALRKLFEEHGAKLVIARPDVQNVRTVKACRKHGFTWQNTQRMGGDTPYYAAVFTLERGDLSCHS